MKTLLGTLLLFFAGQLLAHPSWGIAVDQHRNIYFGDISHNGRGTVWKLSNTGELIALAKDFHCHNVSLDTEGTLWAAHGENMQMLVAFKPDGTRDTVITSPGFDNFYGGNCTVSPNGKVYFGIDHYIWTLNEHGQRVKAHKHRLEWNQTVYADEEENLYVPDIGGDANGKVLKLCNNGEMEVLGTNLIQPLNRTKDKHNDILLGITKGCDGYIYAAETAGKRIIKFTGTGKYENFYQSADGWTPTAIDFFSGDAYIMEYQTADGIKGPRIVKIDEAGKKTILFTYKD